MNKKPRGTLIIIGGHEGKEKEGDRTILTAVARKASGAKGRLVIVTVATQSPEESAKQYMSIFRDLGVRDVEALDLQAREDGYDDAVVRAIERASVVFFTGGDQLRITSQMGDTPVFQCLEEVYRAGATIAGTSAGAAAMPETMLISGPSDSSFTISSLGMTPGLGLIKGVVIDSHFAERGRIGRLLGAVAQNPRNVGLGIDENTALVVDPDQTFKVLGSGAVYVVDGSGITYTSLSEQNPEGVVSIYDVKLHILRENDRFDLTQRCPIAGDQPASTAS